MIEEKQLIEVLKRQKHVLTFEDSNPIDEGFNYGIDRAIQFISVQPKVGEWIPVEERLPNVYKTVLITTYNQEVRTAFLDGEHYWFSGLFTYTFDDVLAWKPLPEPYKGETE